MMRYLIEDSHEPTHAECVRALASFLRAGAHYLTHAEWGCKAGVHTAWIIVEAENDDQARLMVPPVIRKSARVVRLNTFTPEEIRQLQQESP
jgi:hypothetical protein